MAPHSTQLIAFSVISSYHSPPFQASRVGVTSFSIIICVWKRVNVIMLFILLPFSPDSSFLEVQRLSLHEFSSASSLLRPCILFLMIWLTPRHQKPACMIILYVPPHRSVPLRVLITRKYIPSDSSISQVIKCTCVQCFMCIRCGLALCALVGYLFVSFVYSRGGAALRHD